MHLTAEWFVYILECADRSYYVGHTQDLHERVNVHNSGRGSAWTTLRCPVRLVYWERARSEVASIARERQLKGWSRSKKAALIAGDLERLMDLSKRHIHVSDDDVTI